MAISRCAASGDPAGTGGRTGFGMRRGCMRGRLRKRRASSATSRKSMKRSSRGSRRGDRHIRSRRPSLQCPAAPGPDFRPAQPDVHRPAGRIAERRPPSSSGPGAARWTGNGGIPPRHHGRGGAPGRSVTGHDATSPARWIMLRRNCQPPTRPHPIADAQHNSRRNIIRPRAIRSGSASRPSSAGTTGP